jgi:uncharacterized protein YicC (UPF0701 family)
MGHMEDYEKEYLSAIKVLGNGKADFLKAYFRAQEDLVSDRAKEAGDFAKEMETELKDLNKQIEEAEKGLAETITWLEESVRVKEAKFLVEERSLDEDVEISISRGSFLGGRPVQPERHLCQRPGDESTRTVGHG